MLMGSGNNTACELPIIVAHTGLTMTNLMGWDLQSIIFGVGGRRGRQASKWQASMV